jgi:hypothetical protein
MLKPVRAFLTLLIYTLYSIALDLLYYWPYSYYLYYPSSYELLSYGMITPLWEEALYRYGPLEVAAYLGKGLILPTAVMSSMLFGWGHGEGEMSILYQGVFGLFLCWIYVKNGMSYLSSVTLHGVWNILCLIYLGNLTIK